MEGLSWGLIKLCAKSYASNCTDRNGTDSNKHRLSFKYFCTELFSIQKLGPEKNYAAGKDKKVSRKLSRS